MAKVASGRAMAMTCLFFMIFEKLIILLSAIYYNRRFDLFHHTPRRSFHVVFGNLPGAECLDNAVALGLAENHHGITDLDILAKRKAGRGGNQDMNNLTAEISHVPAVFG